MPDLNTDASARWRVGSKVPLNVYEGDRPVCQCHTPKDAQRIVDAMNVPQPERGSNPIRSKIRAHALKHPFTCEACQHGSHEKCTLICQECSSPCACYETHNHEKPAEIPAGYVLETRNGLRGLYPEEAQ